MDDLSGRPGVERLYRTIETFVEAVRPIRALGRTLAPKQSLENLDTSLGFVRFHCCLILAYRPEAADLPVVQADLDALARLDAIRRTSQIVEDLKREGGPSSAALASMETLESEVMRWAEASLANPEMQEILAIYRKDQSPFRDFLLTSPKVDPPPAS